MDRSGIMICFLYVSAWDSGPKPQRDMWIAFSRQYANGATGEVYYVCPAANPPGYIYANVEEPILTLNPEVTNINYEFP